MIIPSAFGSYRSTGPTSAPRLAFVEDQSGTNDPIDQARWQFEVKKQKDGEAGTTLSFRGQVRLREPRPVQSMKGRRTPSFSVKVQITAMATNGHAHSAHSDGATVRAVAVEDVRCEFARRYVYGGDGGEKERTGALAKAWKPALQDAQADQLIAGEVSRDREIIWLASP
jgi:hypothetical protein